MDWLKILLSVSSHTGDVKVAMVRGWGWGYEVCSVECGAGIQMEGVFISMGIVTVI
jgi:hypothetical protein